MVQPNALRAPARRAGSTRPVSQRAKASRRPVVQNSDLLRQLERLAGGRKHTQSTGPDGFLWLLRIAAMEEVGDRRFGPPARSGG